MAYIDREQVCENCNNKNYCEREKCPVYKVTPANVVSKSEGEWIRQKGSPEAICSNCGREVVYQVIDNKWAFENYCPHCGAKMKGKIE